MSSFSNQGMQINAMMWYYYTLSKMGKILEDRQNLIL